MSNVKTLLFTILLGLFLASTANADSIYGPYNAYGIGVSETQAFANAEVDAWSLANEIQETLPEGHVVMMLSYSTSSEWNAPQYTLVFFVHVSE